MPWLTPIVGIALVGAMYLRVAGLPRVDTHGPLHRVGIMDPLCGGTRATYMLVHGDLAAAWSWNPLVPLLAMIALAILLRLATGLVTGRWLSLGGFPRVWIVGIGLAMVVIEVNQQMQAKRLIEVVPK